METIMQCCSYFQECHSNAANNSLWLVFLLSSIKGWLDNEGLPCGENRLQLLCHGGLLLWLTSEREPTDLSCMREKKIKRMFQDWICWNNSLWRNIRPIYLMKNSIWCASRFSISWGKPCTWFLPSNIYFFLGSCFIAIFSSLFNL